MKSDVSIVIPTWNGIDLLKRFLPSVISAAERYSKQTNRNVEIIVVDDGGTDESYNWLLAQRERIKRQNTDSNERVELCALRNDVNQGFGATTNKGINSARFPLVFLLNNDVEVNEDAILPLVENFENPEIFAAHCKAYDFEGGHICGMGKIGDFSRGFIRVHESYLEVGLNGNKKQNAFYSMFGGGGSTMYDRRKFLEMGGFEELLYPNYWEDIEISYRAWKRGFTVVYEPRATVYHRISSTMRTFNRRQIWRVKQRNRIIFNWINLHDREMIRSHIYWICILVLTAPITLKPGFLLAFWQVLKNFKKIKARREEEKKLAKRTDREVFAIFTELKKRVDITTSI